MKKAIVIFRTLFLLFIVIFTVRGVAFLPQMVRTDTERAARCTEQLYYAFRGAWIAIAWIALETVGGWWLMTRGKPGAPPAETKLPAA